ncbi:hypothetical protein TorRG33x02_016070, partial [Trema orientale]
MEERVSDEPLLRLCQSYFLVSEFKGYYLLSSEEVGAGARARGPGLWGRREKREGGMRG